MPLQMKVGIRLTSQSDNKWLTYTCEMKLQELMLEELHH